MLKFPKRKVKEGRKKKSLLNITGNREPGPAKQSVISNPIEDGSAPAVPPSVATHSHVLRQRPSAARVLLLAHEPPPPQMLLWRRRRLSRGGEAAPARENKQEEGKEEGVDEDEGGSEGFKKRNYAVARPRREWLNLRFDGRHRSQRRRRRRRK